MGDLKRSLGLAECIFFGVGSILGAGIYTLIGKVAGHAGYLTWLAFAIAFICALFTAFSYAELSAAFPKAGGEFEYAKNAFGKKTGIAIGFIISLNGIVSAATVSLGFAGYLSVFLEIPQLLSSLAVVVLLFGINMTGIKQSSVANIIFTIIEAAGLVLIIWVAFPSIKNSELGKIPEGGFSTILSAAALSFFAYIGFEDIVKLAEETKQPEKNIPKALLIASLIVAGIYVLVAICVVGVLSPEELGKSEKPLAEVAGKEMGQAGIFIISAVALFATANTILSNMLSSSRVLYGIASETKFLKLFSFVMPKTKTPVWALLFILLLASGFILIGKIETIARIATIFIFVTFIVVNLSVITLRIKKKNISRPYRVPLNIKNIPIISVAGILLTIVLLAYTIRGLITGETTE